MGTVLLVTQHRHYLTKKDSREVEERNN